jgi:hypothetical protein
MRNEDTANLSPHDWWELTPAQRVQLLLVLRDLSEKVAIWGSLEAYYDTVEDCARREVKSGLHYKQQVGEADQ